MRNRIFKNILLIFAIGAAALSGGCSSLSKAQLEGVATFAQTCDSFSAYPSLLFLEMAKIREESYIWYASSLTSPEKRVAELVEISGFKKSQEKIAKGTDISLKILSDYSSALKSLAHENRVIDPGREIRSAGRAIDSLIISFNSLKLAQPVTSGIISSAARIIGYGAQLNASRARANAITKFIPSGDTLVQEICRSLETLLKDESIKALIDHEQKMLVNNYLSYVGIRGGDINEDRRFCSLLEKSADLDKLRSSTVTSVGSLRRAHGKMAAQIKEGISLFEQLEAIKEFGYEVEKLSKIVRKWQKRG